MVDAIVTDPPYHLTSIVERFGKEGSAPAKDKDGAFKRQSVGFMGKEWDGGDIAFDPMTWSLCLGLLKPGGHLIAFSASKNYHRMAVAIENAGFEIRDQIMWLYGSGFPKSLNIGKVIDKRLGNEREVIGTRISAFGDADGSETEDGRNLWGKESTKEVELTKGNSEWEGWGTALKPAHEPIVLARKPLSEKSIADNVLKWGTGAINIDDCRVESERYPANLMHDGLQEEWARYFYCPKTSSAEKNNGAVKNTHPTVKPVELMKYLCRLVTPKGGTILDPFMGSGSTGIAAKDEGFDFIGIEKEPEYYDIAEVRIKKTAPLFDFMT